MAWKYYPQFTEAEMCCKCGCGMLPSEEFMDWLHALRMEWRKPMKVVSGARCPKHNSLVSKSGSKGPHTIGALDFLIHTTDLFYFVELAISKGATGLGYRQKLGSPLHTRVLHVDNIITAEHPHIARPTMWSY